MCIRDSHFAVQSHHRLELAEVVHVRFGAFIDHLVGAAHVAQAFLRRHFLGIGTHGNVGVQLLAHIASDGGPAFRLGHQCLRGQQLVLFRKPHETGHQRFAMGTAGIAAAIGGNGHDPRGIHDLFEGQPQFVRCLLDTSRCV